MRASILIFATLLAFACTTSGGSEQLIDRQWTLDWIPGFETMPAGVAVPTIGFGSDGRMSGNTGCNSASASYTVEGDRLTISRLLTTKRACVAQGGDELEGAYVPAVEATRRYRITDGKLHLLDDGGSVLARFR